MKPSDVEPLRRAHAKLLTDLERLQASVQPSSQVGLMDLCDQLGAVRDHLANHFRLEEEDGYLSAISDRQPRLDRTVQHLAREHPALMQALDSVFHKAAHASQIDERLRGAIRSWVESVHEHENRENRAIEEAFDQDIGPAD